ncbi:hypothetical protein CI109_101305 [Kwoniella shandongensis]|uniref:Uncharacterized protein n=1 Tax=Kwoniella shandongensis TaxID=1734106 RepID=A0A5M6BW69_9TREE|nr:uncharacterized protein CI109_005317 [Kwoniella shandongensis]KAA5526360.1 hypothetical protein CI109_005317 [Kwoniella shandongensis]
MTPRAVSPTTRGSTVASFATGSHVSGNPSSVSQFSTLRIPEVNHNQSRDYNLPSQPAYQRQREMTAPTDSEGSEPYRSPSPMAVRVIVTEGSSQGPMDKQDCPTRAGEVLTCKKVLDICERR